MILDMVVHLRRPGEAKLGVVDVPAAWRVAVVALNKLEARIVVSRVMEMRAGPVVASWVLALTAIKGVADSSSVAGLARTMNTDGE